MEVLPKIRKEYAGLSATHQKIADYILHFPKEVISKTSAEIGEASGTSSATVVRFVRKIGYSGLDDLKVHLASEHVVMRNDKEIDPIISKDDSIDALCDKIEVLTKETVTDVFVTIDKKLLQQAITAVKKSRRIYLFGIGASSLVAYDLFHKLNRAGRQASYVFDSHIGIEMLSYATADDVVIAITYSGYTKEVLLACNYAREKNAHLIIITRNNSAKLHVLADEVLLVPGNEHLLRVGAISSLYSSMLVGTVLYLGVIQEDIEQGVEENMRLTKQWVSPLKDEKEE